MAQRLTVTKTCKLYIGGALARSESGRTVRVTDHQGEFMANAALKNSIADHGERPKGAVALSCKDDTLTTTCHARRQACK